MFTKEDEGEDTSAVSVEVKTTHHGVVDLNNIPGKVKRMLIESGDIAPERFVSAPSGIDRDNAPGRVLAPLREEAKKRWSKFAKGIKTKTKKEPTIFKVGDIVLFKKHASEIVEINEKKGLKIIKKDGTTSGWIWFTKVKLVDSESLEKQQEE